MVFSTVIFLFLFLPAVLGIYFLVVKSLKNSVLLFFSLVFYAWGEELYVLVILFSTLANYICGLLIGNTNSRLYKKIYVGMGITSNVLLLVFFKYAGFLVENINIIFTSIHFPQIQSPEIHLPIGISFFTFQAITYLVDVYRDECAPQKNLIKMALYISLFPQLIAGPIVRYGSIADQLSQRSSSWLNFSAGARIFAIGLAKKVLIANQMAIVADGIFALSPESLTVQVAWLGIVCYALQIYFDFSGYSEMALGLGKIFGFTFPVNFNYPYIASSIQEFWRRWHISLSNWFRDYLYIPLGGNRKGPLHTYFNLVTVFLLCGIWHGASWGFVVWGLYHGLFLILERMGLKKIINKLWKPLRHGYALVVVLVGWVFFRADDLDHALSYLQSMFGLIENTSDVGLREFITREGRTILFIALIASTPLIKNAFESLMNKKTSGYPVLIKSMEPIFLFSLFFLSTAYLAMDTYNPFIYFRF